MDYNPPVLLFKASTLNRVISFRMASRQVGIVFWAWSVSGASLKCLLADSNYLCMVYIVQIKMEESSFFLIVEPCLIFKAFRGIFNRPICIRVNIICFFFTFSINNKYRPSILRRYALSQINSPPLHSLSLVRSEPPRLFFVCLRTKQQSPPSWT